MVSQRESVVVSGNGMNQTLKWNGAKVPHASTDHFGDHDISLLASGLPNEVRRGCHTRAQVQAMNPRTR